MRTTSTLILIALLCFAVTNAGCDSHKAERASLQQQISDREVELASLNEQLAAVSRDLESLPEEIKQNADDLQQHERRRTKLRDDLADYLLDHKMAAVALMATAGGAATIINQNIDQDTKSGLRVVGIIGALYCIANSDECADLAARVLYFGSQIEIADKNITDVTSTLSMKKSSLEEREKEHATLGQMIANKTSERDGLRQKHDSLLCTVCF